MTPRDFNRYLDAMDKAERRAIRHARIVTFCVSAGVWIILGAVAVAWWNGWTVWPQTVTR